MRLNQAIRFSIVAFPLLGCGSDKQSSTTPASGDPCVVDTACKGTRICVAGECVDPTPIDAGILDTGATLDAGVTDATGTPIDGTAPTGLSCGTQVQDCSCPTTLVAPYEIAKNDTCASGQAIFEECPATCAGGNPALQLICFCRDKTADCSKDILGVASFSCGDGTCAAGQADCAAPTVLQCGRLLIRCPTGRNASCSVSSDPNNYYAFSTCFSDIPYVCMRERNDSGLPQSGCVADLNASCELPQEYPFVYNGTPCR